VGGDWCTAVPCGDPVRPADPVLVPFEPAESRDAPGPDQGECGPAVHAAGADHVWPDPVPDGHPGGL